MVEADDTLCVPVAESQVDIQGGRIGCLTGHDLTDYDYVSVGTGRDLTDYNYVSVGRDGFVPIRADGTYRPTFINAGLNIMQREEMCELLEGFMDCFAWEYTEMPGLSRELVEHRMPIKKGFWPYKQLARNFSQEITSKIKEEVDRLLRAGFLQLCRYVEWASNVVPVEKKNTRKIRVCADF
jgi:hypothetical protein